MRCDAIACGISGQLCSRMREYRTLRELKENVLMIEPLLLGIVAGLIPVTLAGLFVAAYLQYKRGNQLGA